MKAIEIENKMTGDNAPVKKELTGKDGKPIETVVSPGAEIDYSKLPLELRRQLLAELTKNADT